MKRASLAIAFVVVLTLTGCGLTFEELAAARERCESLGGIFHQWEDGLIYAQHSECDFNRDSKP